MTSMIKLQPTHGRLRLTQGLFFGSLILLLSGCLGDQIGGEGEAGGHCKEKERRPLALDENSPLGFAAEDILAFAWGPFEVGLGWSIPPEYGGLALTPEAGDTTLSLDIGSDVVRATFVVNEENDSYLDAAGYCPDFVEIETELHLATENGAFDDTFPLVLRAEHIAGASAVVPLEPGSLGGSFDLEETGPLTVLGLETQADRSELTQVALELSVTPERAFGAMNADFNLFFGEGPTGAVSGARVPFGRIEADCYEEDFGGALDDGEAVSRLEARLAGSHPLLFVWSDDLPDRSLDLTIEPSAFCLAPNLMASLAFSADVELRDPASGELVAAWPLTGSATYAGDGAFVQISLGHDAYLVDTFSPDDLAATIGDFGVDFSGADAVGLQVTLELDTEESWYGNLALHAIQTVDDRDPPCQSEPVANDEGAGNCSGGFESSQIAATAVINQITR